MEWVTLSGSMASSSMASKISNISLETSHGWPKNGGYHGPLKKKHQKSHSLLDSHPDKIWKSPEISQFGQTHIGRFRIVKGLPIVVYLIVGT